MFLESLSWRRIWRWMFDDCELHLIPYHVAQVAHLITTRFTLSHLAVMAWVARSDDAVSVPMIRVSLHLRIHAIIVMLLWWLLLSLLLDLRMIVGIKSAILTRDDANLLIVVFGATWAVLFSIFEAVEGEKSIRHWSDYATSCWYLRGILRSAKRVTTIVPATSRKRIVAALELPGYLLVGRSTSRHKHHVKAR